MTLRDHYLMTLWCQKIWKEINPKGWEFVERNLFSQKSVIRKMEYDTLTVEKIKFALEGKREVNPQTISNFSQLENRFKGRDIFALQTITVDFFRDIEFVSVRGIEKDNPHKKDYPLLAGIFGLIDDKAFNSVDIGSFISTFSHSEPRYNLTCFNHFIDIKKGKGRFDDFDGYSYYLGSASKDQYEKRFGLAIDKAVMLWFSNEYIHAFGKWYKNCSPSLYRYSFYQEKGYATPEEELKERFPEKGFPVSIFLPIDNLARFWYEEFLSSKDWLALAPVMHALEDVTIPHHSAGYVGNWHQQYEREVKVERYLFNSEIEEKAKRLFREWSNSSVKISSLEKEDWQITPAINWRIDYLVTWLALNSYRIYEEVYFHFKRGYRFDEKSHLELLEKALALGVLIQEKALLEIKE